MDVEIKEMTTEDLDRMCIKHKELNPDRPIREDIKQSLIDYVEKGWVPGGFLMSVLANDLVGALGRADSYNRATIFQITQYLYNDMPANSWGSPEIVDKYLKELSLAPDK